MKTFDLLLFTASQHAQEGQKLHVVATGLVMKGIPAQDNARVMVASMGLHVSSVCLEDTARIAGVGFLW